MNKQIIALHGAGMNGSVWGRLPLSCEALSFPGHGATGGAFLTSIGRMAAWTADHLEKKPDNSVVLMGHSMGALVALEAARHPAVATLVLLGAAAKMPVNAELLRQAAETASAAVDMILKWGVSSLNPEASALRAALKDSMNPEALLNDLKSCDAYADAEARAHALQKPVLVIAGLEDKMTKSADGKALAGLFRHGRFHILSDCGHMMMAEKPAETAAAIERFIDELD